MDATIRLEIICKDCGKTSERYPKETFYAPNDWPLMVQNGKIVGLCEADFFFDQAERERMIIEAL